MAFNGSIPPADFAPSMKGYSGQGEFRFWCQKVLPLVYDDSLSYYELLNKVVNYLNKAIEDVANVEENVTNLDNSYKQLQDYVNTHFNELSDSFNELKQFVDDYFDSLDVQEEIDNKLDEMARDGSLSILVEPIVQGVAPNIIGEWLANNVDPVGSAVIVDSSLTVPSAAADAKVVGDKITNLKSALTHTERGFNFDKSGLNLGYNYAINAVFVRGGVNQAGEIQTTTQTRARTDYLQISGEHRIKNLTNGRIAIQILQINLPIGNGYTAPVTYRNDANIDFNFNENYLYVILLKDLNDENSMSDEALQAANENIIITEGVFDSESIISLSEKSNLFVNLLNGNANPYTGIINSNAEFRRTDYIPIKPGEKLCVTDNYCNICFYDSSKQFLSGVAINNTTYDAIGTRLYPYSVITVPDKTNYVIFATQRDEWERQIATKVTGATLYPADYKLSPQFIPERNIIHDLSSCLYDFNLEKMNYFPSMELSGKDSGNFVENSGFVMSSGTIRPFKYTTMEKSKISAIFTMSSNGIIRFGYDSSNVSIGDTTSDSMTVCIIDSINKTMDLRLWNWSGNFGDIIASASFDFNLTNGHKYCVTLEKDGVYHHIAKLYDCDTPNNVAIAEYIRNYNIDAETVSGFVRAWGCGRFTVMSGNVTLKRFSMWSTGNAHPKMYIIGDSFVEQAGRNRLCGFGQRLYDATNGDAFLSGRGGARADNVLKRLPFELNVCHPQYCVIEIGTNDSVGSSSNINTFKSQIETIIEVLERERIIPVLVTISRRTDTDNLSFIQQANPWIKSLGYRYIDEAMAMSTGDGVTPDNSKYQSDGIHPSLAGGKAVFDWIQANLPELIN